MVKQMPIFNYQDWAGQDTERVSSIHSQFLQIQTSSSPGLPVEGTRTRVMPVRSNAVPSQRRHRPEGGGGERF